MADEIKCPDDVFLKKTEPKQPTKKSDGVGLVKKESGPLSVIRNWMKNSPFYARIRDLNNSESTPYKNKPVNAVEVGIKISF